MCAQIPVTASFNNYLTVIRRYNW